MTDYSVQTNPQPYNDAEAPPSTTRPVMQPDNPYASTRGSITNKQLPAFDEAIINKYNRSGPGYTSYPTAPPVSRPARAAALTLLMSFVVTGPPCTPISPMMPERIPVAPPPMVTSRTITAVNSSILRESMSRG